MKSRFVFQASALRALTIDCRATSAVEFAIVLPVLALLVFGGYQANEALSAYRKVTLTARTVADLTSQYTTMNTTDVTTVLNASDQIMTPFNTSALTIILTEYATDTLGRTTVTWSKGLNCVAPNCNTPVAGATATLPPNVAQVGTSLIYSQVTYSFTPAVAYKLTGSFQMSSQIFMSPRSIQSVTYSGT